MTKQSGFSLIELSIVILIMGLLASGTLQGMASLKRSNDVKDTIDRMDAIENALIAYSIKHGTLPCPANIREKTHDSDFGVRSGGDDGDTDCTNDSIQANWQSTTGNLVAYGGVPTRSLGLPDEYAFDGYKRRFNYMVSRDVLDDADVFSMDNGVIQVNPSRTDEAVYALWSTGANGHGGWSTIGKRTSSKSINTDEYENCDCNVSGNVTAYNEIVVQAMKHGEAQNTFDDIVRYRTKEQLQVHVANATNQPYWVLGAW